MEIKNIFSLYIACIFVVSNSFAQKINYEKFSASLKVLGCGNNKLADIKSDYSKFLLLDSSKIATKNKIAYYSDYGFTCYNMYLATKNKNFISQSNLLYKKGLAINPKQNGTLWNYACNLAILGECNEAMGGKLKD